VGIGDTLIRQAEQSVILLTSWVSASQVGGGVALKVAHAAGCRADFTPTVILGRHPGLGAPGGGPVPDSLFGSVLTGIRDQGRLSVASAIYCGYFATEGQVIEVARLIDDARALNPEILVVVDPILGDAKAPGEAGALYVPKPVALAIRNLLVPRADILTPNLFELSWLSDQSVESHAEIIGAARHLCDKVIVTSAMEGTDEIGVIGVEPVTAWSVSTPRFDAVPKGTGDLFASSLVCALLHDYRLVDAARYSAGLVHVVLKASTCNASADLNLDNDVLNAPFDLPKMRRLGTTRPAWALGVDGAPGGWAGVMVDLNGIEPARVELFKSFDAVLESDAQIIAVDMPIGFEDAPGPNGMRACEFEARQILGPRRSSIFPTPLRDTLYVADYAEALATNKELGGKGISKQAFNLGTKMREIDRLMEPKLEGAVFETHPETSFTVLNRAPAKHSKKTPEGREERLALLQARGLDRTLFVPHRYKHKDCAADDLVDAGLCALTALRIAEGEAQCLPYDPPRDRKGLRMAIWA
jgi:pyridoxal kinase